MMSLQGCRLSAGAAGARSSQGEHVRVEGPYDTSQCDSVKDRQAAWQRRVHDIPTHHSHTALREPTDRTQLDPHTGQELYTGKGMQGPMDIQVGAQWAYR